MARSSFVMKKAHGWTRRRFDEVVPFLFDLVILLAIERAQKALVIGDWSVIVVGVHPVR